MDSEMEPLHRERTGKGSEEACWTSRPVAYTWGIAGSLLLLSASSVAAVDEAWSGSLRLHPLPDFIGNLFQATEHFGTPYGAVLILITIWLIQPDVRSRVSRTLVAAITAGLLADLVKLCVTRTRPKAFDFDYSVWSSFTGVFQWGAGGSKHQGFPSAHTAFAIAFAVMLGEMFPKARRWFLCLGGLVALQRISTLAHFPSDVLAGAAVGLVTARYFLGTTPLGLVYDRMERYYFPGESPSQRGQVAANSPVVALSPIEIRNAEPAQSV